MGRITPKTIMVSMRRDYDIPKGADFRDTAMYIFDKYKTNLRLDVGGCLYEAMKTAEGQGKIIRKEKKQTLEQGALSL